MYCFNKYHCNNKSPYSILRLLFNLIISINLLTSLISASGGYDNGTATGKGKIGLDLTWNPFNYFQKGQSYVVISYGFTDKFNFHGYYSIQTNGSHNYYLGLFYQFYNTKKLDLATAFGLREYRPKSESHLFAPQILYTIHLFNNLRIGGSFVSIRNIDNINKSIGTTVDISFIIPIIKNSSKKGKINSLDLCFGAFRPVIWKPDESNWHPTYSIDIKF